MTSNSPALLAPQPMVINSWQMKTGLFKLLVMKHKTLEMTKTTYVYGFVTTKKVNMQWFMPISCCLKQLNTHLDVSLVKIGMPMI